MKDALTAAVLDLDRACRAGLGARAAADAGVGMDVEWCSHFPLSPAADKGDSSSPNHITADAYA